MTKRILAMLLALCLMAGSAMAASYTDYYRIDGIVISVAGDSNIRTMPSLGGQVIGVLPNGGIAEFLSGYCCDARGVTWLLVQYNGMVGWVSEKYVEMNGVDETNFYAYGNSYAPSYPSYDYEQEGDSEYPVYDYGYDHDQEGDSEFPVYDYGEPESSDYISSYGSVVATGGDTNIRSWADINSEKVGTLPNGKTAIYKGSSYTDDRGVRWDYIEYRGVQGWVSSRYTTLYS